MVLPKPIPGRILGVDTSVSQGRLDVPTLVHCGVKFLIAKATDGEHDIDKQWAATALACSDAGIAWTAYGVLEPYGSARAKAQAANFVQRVKGSGIRFAPACDFELAHGLSGLDALKSALVWVNEVEQALGTLCMVYTGPSFIETLEKYAGHTADAILAGLKERPLWVAHYTQDHMMLPMVPSPWGPEMAFVEGDTRLIWQASGGHQASRNYSTLPGTHIDVDVDWFMGTVEQLPGYQAAA